MLIKTECTVCDSSPLPRVADQFCTLMLLQTEKEGMYAEIIQDKDNQQTMLYLVFFFDSFSRVDPLELIEEVLREVSIALVQEGTQTHSTANIS